MSFMNNTSNTSYSTPIFHDVKPSLKKTEIFFTLLEKHPSNYSKTNAERN